MEARLAALKAREERLGPMPAPPVMAWDVEEPTEELHTEEALRVVRRAEAQTEQNSRAASKAEELRAYLWQLEQNENVELGDGYDDAVDFAVEVSAPAQDRSQALGGHLPSFLEKYFLPEAAKKEFVDEDADTEAVSVAGTAELAPISDRAEAKLLAEVEKLDAIIAERITAAEATRTRLRSEISTLRAEQESQRAHHEADREAFLRHLQGVGNWRPHGGRVDSPRSGKDPAALSRASERSTQASIE